MNINKPMPKENDPIENRLREISEAIVFLTKKVSAMEERMDRESARRASIAPLDIPPRPIYAGSISQEVDQVNIPRPSGGNITAYNQNLGDDNFVKAETKGESLETVIGLKWLGKIGILALILGVAFFMKYAFENDWIGEAGRVVLGVFTGMFLIILGDYLRQKYASYAATLTGGGIAILYLSIYAGFAYYDLIEQMSAFVLMMIITAMGAFLSVRYERLSLAILSIIGGFLTPLLLSTGENNQVALFSYITILNLGILAISFYRNWQKLNLLGIAATSFLYLGWAGRYYNDNQLFLTEAFLTLWFIIYSVAIVSHNILSRKKADYSDLALIVVNAFFYFGISYSLLSNDYGMYLGFFTVLLAAVYFVFARVSYQANPEDNRLALFFSSISIFFLTISAPIQFDGVWVTISWAIEAVVLIAIGFYLKNRKMRFYAWVLLVIVAIRLVFIDNYETIPLDDFLIIFNKRFLTFTIGAFSFAAVYYLYGKYESLVASGKGKAKPIALFLFNLLLLWNLSSEVNSYFDNQAQVQKYKTSYPVCQQWIYDSRGRSTENLSCSREFERFNVQRIADQKKVDDITSRKDAILNILWSFYAIILLAFGIKDKNRLLRLMGIWLLGVTIIKLFFYGIMAMQGIYRIVAFIFMGVVLLVASYAYNIYKEKIKEII